MVVRCERHVEIAGPARGAEVPELPGHYPRVGDEYAVLTVYIPGTTPRGRLPVDLVILGEDRTPIWVPAAMFSVVSGEIPSTWKIQIRGDGTMEIGPGTWIENRVLGGFRSEDADELRAARELFARGLAEMGIG